MSAMEKCEPVVQLAEAYVELEAARIATREYAEKIREQLQLPPDLTPWWRQT